MLLNNLTHTHTPTKGSVKNPMKSRMKSLVPKSIAGLYCLALAVLNRVAGLGQCETSPIAFCTRGNMTVNRNLQFILKAAAKLVLSLQQLSLQIKWTGASHVRSKKQSHRFVVLSVLRLKLNSLEFASAAPSESRLTGDKDMVCVPRACRIRHKRRRH